MCLHNTYTRIYLYCRATEVASDVVQIITKPADEEEDVSAYYYLILYTILFYDILYNNMCMCSSSSLALQQEPR